MTSEATHLLVADALLVLHAMFVAFVVFGLVLVLAGGALGWAWVRNPWFRLFHLLAIGIVVIQSWLGMICPLTTWEMTFRAKAGGATYTGAFIAHWLESLIYYQAPPWVFSLIYTVFGSLVALSWFWVRPRPFAGKQLDDDPG